MATTTLTKNIKLRISSNLTADAKYNLERLDLLGSTFLVDSTNTLNIRAQTDILIEPESADVDGAGVGGTVSIGTANHLLANLDLWGTSVTVPVSLGLKDQAASGTSHMRLKYNSTIRGTLDSTDRNLSIDLEGADRSIVLGGSYTQLGGDLILNLSGPTSLILPLTGTVATLSNVETFTNKSMDGLQNSFTNIQYASLNLTNSIINSDISAFAAIAYSKLNLSNAIVNSDIATNAAISYSKLALTGSIVNADISNTASISYSKLNLVNSVVNNDISPTAAISRSKLVAGIPNQIVINDPTTGLLSSTNILPIALGGTGASDPTSAMFNLLPLQSGNSGKFLKTDGAATSWVNIATSSGIFGFEQDWTVGTSITVNHGLNTGNVIVSVIDNTGSIVYPDIQVSGINSVIVTSSEAPVGTWKVVIHGGS